MKNKKRQLKLRTALLTVLTVALIASAAAFLGASAAESVSPSDVSGSDVNSGSIVTRGASPEMNNEVPNDLGDPVITITSVKYLEEFESSIHLPIFSIAGDNIFADCGNGTPVPFSSSLLYKYPTIRIYGDK